MNGCAIKGRCSPRALILAVYTGGYWFLLYNLLHSTLHLKMALSVLEMRLECERIEGWNLALIAGVHRLREIRKRQRQHRFWVHPSLRGREQHGTYGHLVRELSLDAERFHQYFRMSEDQFGHLLGMMEEGLTKRCLSREAISPRQRLAICLR